MLYSSDTGSPYTSIKLTGAECFVDSYRHDDQRLYFLSLFGPHSAVKANWAWIITNQNSGFNIQYDYVKFTGTFHSILTKMDEHNTHCVMIDNDATAMVGIYSNSYVQVGNNIKETYFDNFSRRLKVPLKKDWEPSIWRIGEKSGAISLLNGMGVEAYKFDLSQDLWLDAIKQGLKAGELV